MNALIAYFSYTGHTRGIAQKMRGITDGTLFEIRPAIPYDPDYNTTERQGRKETRDGYQPPPAKSSSPSSPTAAAGWATSLPTSRRWPGGRRC